MSVLYISALPQQLAEKYDPKKVLTLTEISHQTVQRLDRARQEQSHSNLCDLAYKSLGSVLSRQLWFEFEIETQRPGWVAFRLSDQGVAQWLQHAQEDLHRLPENSSSQDRSHPDQQQRPLAKTDAVLWQMQYTHARCCTLLKLWQETQSGHSSGPLWGADRGGADRWRDRSTADIPVAANLPWLHDSQQLSVSTPQAHQLIQALIATADDMLWMPERSPDRQHALLLKRAAHLCQSFDEFYRGCLYGFSQVSPIAAPPATLQFEALFGLVAATRNLLSVLLCQHFEAASPTSL